MSEGVDWMGGMDVLVGRALASSDVVCGERGPLFQAAVVVVMSVLAGARGAISAARGDGPGGGRWQESNEAACNGRAGW